MPTFLWAPGLLRNKIVLSVESHLVDKAGLKALFNADRQWKERIQIQAGFTHRLSRKDKPQTNSTTKGIDSAPKRKSPNFASVVFGDFPCYGWLSRRGVGGWGQMKIWLFEGTFWERGGGWGGGAGVNERQMRVVPTQLFSQSSSKARRTGRSTGNLRWVLPLFAVARRLAEGWKCLQWGTTSKPFPI